MKTITSIPWLKPGAINGIAILFILFLITSCTSAEGEPGTGTLPADGTPIEIGNLSIAPGFSQGMTRSNAGSGIPDPGPSDPEPWPFTWKPNHTLTVRNLVTGTTQFAYTTAGTWQHTSGDKLYMEDYTQGEKFPAFYGPDNADYQNQRTRDLYLAQTHLAGDLELTGRTLAGTVYHQNIDVVVTLDRGNGWGDNDVTFANAIRGFRFKTSADEDIIPYRPTGTNTFRAQLSSSRMPAAKGKGESLFTVNDVSGTYTLESGADKPEKGKRLTLTILYHETGDLEVTTATVADFEDMPNIPPILGETLPKGYDYAVYNWETLVEALKEVGNYKSILQMADIICPEVQSGRTVRDLPGGALYNGGGYSITGLTAPLFNGVGRYSWLYNIHLKDSKVTTSSSQGLLANESWGTITLCSATGNLESTSNSSVGGLVGVNMQGSITRSYTDCTVRANLASCVGGLVGDNSVLIVACAALGTVKGESYTGTLVGRNLNNVYYSYADGTAIGDGNTSIITNDTDPIYTLVIDPTFKTGISSQQRTFIGAKFWTGAPNNSIDYTYEGTKP